MGSGESCVKYVMFCTNFLFVLAGLALVTVGILMEVKVKGVSEILNDTFFAAPIFAIVVGCVVCIIAFFGCCGAINESNCMLVTYSALMLVLMIINVTLGILVLVKGDMVMGQVKMGMAQAFHKNPDSFRTVEKMMMCCGPQGVSSYESIGVVPDTCCALPPCNIPSETYPPCKKAFDVFYKKYGVTIGVISLVLAAFELMAAAFGLCLANHVRTKQMTY